MSNDFTERLRSTLTGSYTIERELGGGGMSRVFVAEELSLGRKVVVKVLSPELGDGINADRFKREISLAARLQHPHIVPLLSAGESGGTAFYTMPLVEGESLRARIAREGALPIADVRRIGRDVADALAYAHAHGVVHRDIKPDNVLLTGDHAVVLDFGVAKAVSAASKTGDVPLATLTSLGTALGTPAYMAPEQVAADPATDHRADIYALGVVLYEMLAGRSPFSGRTPQATLAAHATEQPESIIKLRSSVPADLAALVMRCLEKTPADRPQTASEIVQELNRTASQPTLVPLQAKRGKGARIAAVAAALIVIAVAGVWAMRSRPRVDASVATIAVMPFASAGSDTALDRLGRELVITLAANLDGVNDLRVIDATTVLSATADHSGPLSIADAAALAKKLGAQSVVHGSLLRSGSNVRVDAGLYTVDSVASRAKVTLSASMDSIPALTDSLTWSLLRQIWRTRAPPTPSLASITTHSVPALRAFLEGERVSAEYNWGRAAEAYARAIEADSTFWYAYHRLRLANSWLLRPSDSVVVRKSREHLELFPERDRRMIEAQAIPKRSERIVAMRKVVEAYPDYWPGWMTYGDRLFHEFPISGTSTDEARAAFEHVTQLNPNYAAAWEHLAWASLLVGDTATATRALATFTRIASPASRSENGFDMLTMQRAGLSWASGQETLPRDVRDTIIAWMSPGRSTTQVLLTAALASAISPREADEVYQRALANRPTPELVRAIVIARAGALAQRGDWNAALAVIDAQARAEPDSAYGITAYRLATIGAWLGGVSTADADRRRSGAILDSSSATANQRAELAWLDGIVAVAKNDRVALDAARSRVVAANAPQGSSYARSLNAFSLLAAGNRDAARDSLVKLEWERADGPIALAFTTLVDRLQAARLLSEAGKNDEAARLLRWTDGTYTSIGISRALAVGRPMVAFERGKLAEALGHRDEARRHYTLFLRRFDRPTPAQKHLVTEAEQALARLSNVRDTRK